MGNWQPTLRRPVIYAFTTPDRPDGEIKVGYTTKSADERIRGILGQAVPDPSAYTIILEHPAILPDGRMIHDSDVHHVLEHQLGRHRFKGTEWFRATREDVIAAIESLETGRKLTCGRHQTFGMRPEQSTAVDKAAGYFRRYAEARGKTGLHFLWNAKMRFGKTFTSYKLAQEMGWKRVLVLTYKPAVEDAWREDLKNHADFEGWTFIGNKDQDPAFGDRTVWFSSFQALFPKDGQIPERLNPIFETDWDAIILDEYHFGADKDRAAAIMQDDSEGLDDLELQELIASGEAGIIADHFLHLSGTPFRALATGEFTEDQIFNWTYTDEQRAKAAWNNADGRNPYEALPGMVMMTYKLPQGILDEYAEDELNLDKFFAAGPVDDGGEIAFENEEAVSLWLDFITGTKLNRQEFLEGEKSRSPMPFQDKNIFPYINHSLWYLPSVAACEAMAAKLRAHPTLRQYQVVVAAGAKAGIGVAALPPVRAAIEGNDKTITLSCGKLTTGVTVPEWTAVFMLRSMKSPESYFQTAFRAQSPGSVLVNPKDGPVMKDTCFVFDFDPQRTLTLASEYCYELDRIGGADPSKDDLMSRMQEFLSYMPVLCHDDGVMMELDPGAAIELATSGIGTAMLARRFQSPKMVDLNPLAVMRLQDDPELVSALAKIEAFRNLSKDLETITAEHIKKGKIEADGTEPKEPKPAKESKIDPAVKKLMAEIKTNLLKFITRLPVFMYLNDEREKTALEVIDTTDDALFKRATGITKADFRKLLDLGVFQSEFMNEAIRTFKLVEDNALVYLGDRKIEGAFTAAWDTWVER